MIRPIVQLGDPLLKTPAREVRPDEFASGALNDLVRDMIETLENAGGVGLAAPQVGESVRVILAGSFPNPANPDRPEVPLTPLVNPRIVSASGATEPGWEGCLSFLQFRVNVSRHVAVRVDYRTPVGEPASLEADGFFARVLQHEIDHLDGVLTLDRAGSPADVRPADEPPAEG